MNEDPVHFVLTRAADAPVAELHVPQSACHAAAHDQQQQQHAEQMLRGSRRRRPLVSYTRDDVAAAVESLGPAYEIYAMKVIEQDIDGPCIFDLFE